MSQPEFEYLGPYRVERTLGRGGMGTVYKGVHAKSGEPVAIKVIATGVANQSRFRRRFASEVETLKRLKHPNIVSLVGYGEEHGLLFYSMEYVDGHSLHDHLRQHSRLPWEDVVEVGIQTTSALKHAHDLGIIHRDLKPANLMLNTEGNIKLTDFGIAKLFGSSDMTAVGSVIGTADYMPPEQAEGKGVTVRSDLYGLGGVLYALLTGKAPFSGKSVPEVLYAVRYHPVPDLHEQIPEAPQELCEIVHQLLEKDPQKRPPTALVVGNRFKSLQQGMKKRTGIGGPRPLQSEPEEEKDAVGTQLTSLDLSDVDDDELKLTGEEVQDLIEPELPEEVSPSHEALSHEALSHEALSHEALSHEALSHEALGTHEQRTMLAPEGDHDLDLEEDRGGGNGGAARREAEEHLASDFSHAGLGDEAPLPSAEGPITSPGPSHYTPIDDDDTRPFSLSLDQEHDQAGVDWGQHVSIAGMIALLLGAIGFGWWMLQPRTADEIYEKIMAAVDTGDDGQLLSAKGDIEEFLGRFPADERRSEIEVFADDLELTRWTRILQRRAARGGGREELTAIEQGFLDCMQARAEDYEVAEAKLTAFLDVFGPLGNLPREEQRLVELAQFAAVTGEKVERKTPVAVEQLENLIRAAEKSLPKERLEDYYRDLLLLYGEKRWAGEQMERIRKKLETES